MPATIRRLLFLALLQLLACAAAAQTSAPASVQARRIVSLAPSVTETLFALGAGHAVVGVSTYCDYPPQAKRLPRVGTFLTPSVEEIIKLRPDLIIGVPSPGNEAPVETLERLKLKVLIVDPQTVQQIRASITTIADAIGRPAAGRQLLARIDARMHATEQRLKGVSTRRVLMVVGQRPLVAVGSGTFQNELIRMARGVNVAAGTGFSWPHLSLEKVIAWAPQVIIDGTMGSEEDSRTLDFWKQFPSLPAVRSRRLCGYHSYQLLRPGPRIAGALDIIAHCIHPEQFTAPPAERQ